MPSTKVRGFWGFLLLILMLVSSNAFCAEILPEEAATIKQEFTKEVGQMPIDSAYEALLIERAKALLSSTTSNFLPVSQYFVLVDRNPKTQTVSLAFFDGRGREVFILGSSKTSTGNPTRSGFYETPIGVFQNTPSNMSYRALGTKNDAGWRGLGAKGSRVWDLGWQKTKHPKGGEIEIRPLLHATDPDFGEPRLGRRDSKGCIRISAKFNHFLDRYGVLDFEYEKGDEKVRRILLKDRNSVAFAGSFVVVVDSVH